MKLTGFVKEGFQLNLVGMNKVEHAKEESIEYFSHLVAFFTLWLGHAIKRFY